MCNKKVVRKTIKSREKSHIFALRNDDCHTACPAVLTENFFMDALPDYHFLLSEEGQQSLVDLHVDGIYAYSDSVR